MTRIAALSISALLLSAAALNAQEDTVPSQPDISATLSTGETIEITRDDGQIIKVVVTSSKGARLFLLTDAGRKSR